MGFMNRETTVEVPYSEQDCYNAMLQALEGIKTAKIRSANETTKTIQASLKATFTSLSWGDDAIVQISSGANNQTKVSISSAAKAPSALAGVQQEKNISKILEAFTDALKQFAPVPQSTEGCAQPSSADEILKYKQLLDAGAITQEEYDAKKKQLLGL